MANTAANVRVGKPKATGGISVADTDATLPTDAETALDASFTAAGYVGDDGVTQSISTDVQDIKAWGGDVVRKVQTSQDVTYQFRLIETNDISLGVYYGDDNVTTTTGVTAVKINSTELPHKAFAIDMLDGDVPVRVVIPDGQVTERGDVTFVDTDVIAFDVTITCYPDENGNKAYLYSGSDTSGG